LFIETTSRIRKIPFFRAQKRRRLVAALPLAATDYSSAGIGGANNRSIFMAHGAVIAETRTAFRVRYARTQAARLRNP
jgi:hypothetical protein